MKQDTFSHHEIDIVVPELGPGSEPVRFVMWLVAPGARVIPGERLAEICTHGVVFHLEAEHEGVLQKQLVYPDTTIHAGDILGTLQLDQE